MDLKEYFKELKRRNVFKAALAYLVVGWIILQVISIIFPMFHVPEGISKAVFIILLVGFPVWLVFAWVYEVTPDGLKKTEKIERGKSITHETSNKFNKIIIGALCIAIILLAINVYGTYTQSGNEASNTETSPVQNPSENTSAKKQERSIAVLAFENMSSDKDQEYFADGISEEILNYLAKNPELEVISRTSSFYFKDKEVTTKEIGQKLHVNYLLEGSVRKAGNMVRITAQLINISNGIHIWSETYDRKLDDIFRIQDEIAEAVTRKLEASLLGEKAREVDTEAYTLYLKAKHLYEQSTNESIERSLALLKEANSIDPNYAPIWELMSEIYNFQGFSTPNLPKEKAYELGFSAASKSVEIDPEYAKGYMELARWAMIKFDFEAAKTNAERAIELAPENAAIVRRKGMMAFDSVSQMLEDNKRALELDPLLYVIHFNLGFNNYLTGNYNEALKQMKIYEEYQPGSTVVNTLKAMMFLGLGRIEEAKKEIKKEPDPFWKLYGRIKVSYKSGEKIKAVEMLNEFIEAYPVETVNIADIYAFMGNREKTFEWLEKAVEIKDPTLPEGVYYPTFKKFHKDPRWMEILEDMGVPKDNGIPGYKKS